jgi:hypothetical protein
MLYDYKVGDYVYEPYRPQKPAKVIANLGDAFVFNGKRSFLNESWNSAGVTSLLEIKFLNGTTKKCLSIYLLSFKALIADHEKKLNTHKSKLKDLANL